MFESGLEFLRADFHLHTQKDKEFSYSGEPNDFVKSYISALKQANISVGVITNHNKFDKDEYKALKRAASKEKIFILPGVELTVKEGANGIHTLIVFNPDEWLENGNNHIQTFLTAAFATISNPENRNTKCCYDLKSTLEKLEEYGKDYFVIFAHVDQGSGLFNECGGGLLDGYLKLMYPNGEFTKEELEEIIQIALEMRRRVKEQLKKLGGMEFYDVNFSYIDLEDMSEHYVSVPEQGGGKLIPDGMCNPGQVYTVSRGKSGMIGVFRLESQMLPGNGKIERTGLGSDSKCKEAVNTAFNYLKANGNRISGSISTSTKDYIINYQDLQGIGMTDKLALPTLIALCSIALGKPVVSNLAVLGDITISGTMIKVDELANTLQVCLDSGAKKVLIPSTSFVDFASVPADLMSAFQLIPYQSAEDAVFKALGVE